MLLKELLTLIGFSKIQQICLIKILFLTGALGFVNVDHIIPNNSQAIKINSIGLSSALTKEEKLKRSNEVISSESADYILENAKFDSSIKAFDWIDQIMQQQFARGKMERHEMQDKFKNFVKLNKLIQKFDLINEIKKEGKFDYIVVTGCSEKCIKNKTLFLSRLLIENKVKSENIYFIGSERPGYPYLEASIESVLATNLTKINSLSFKDNLDEVKKTFIRVAQEHLASLTKSTPHKMSEVRKIFKEHPEFFNIQQLLDKLKAESLFMKITWPTESDIILHTSGKTLKKYHVKTIETHNKKIGPHITRSTTKDSAEAWMQDITKLSHNLTYIPKVLLISNQPKAKYQMNVFRSILGDKYDISLAASSCYGKQNLSLLLSELAAIIHEAKDLAVK